MSIGVNCGIIFWTSDSLNSILVEYNGDTSKRFMLIVLIEHIIIGFKLFLVNIIKDKPEWVADDERN